MEVIIGGRKIPEYLADAYLLRYTELIGRLMFPSSNSFVVCDGEEYGMIHSEQIFLVSSIIAEHDEIEVRKADGTVAVVNKDKAKRILNAIVRRSLDYHRAFRGHMATINEILTVEHLEEYDTSVGWPDCSILEHVRGRDK